MAEAELSTIARPYARAIFGRALDSDNGLDNWSSMLSYMAAAVKEQAVVVLLDNPRLSFEEEAGILVDVCGDSLNEEGRNLVKLLAENGRLRLLPEISSQYEMLKDQYQQLMNVTITSAFEVTEADQNNLQTSLNRMLQLEIKLSSKVDSDLLGGVIIRAGDMVIDSSLRGRLEKLAQALS